LYGIGNYDQALEALRFELPDNPDFRLFRVGQLAERGWVYYLKKEYDNAARDLEDAATNARALGDPGSRWLRTVYTRILYVAAGKKDFRTGDKVYGELVQMNGGAVPSPFLLSAHAFLLMAEAKYEDAAKDFEKALGAITPSEDPATFARIQTDLGSCYLNLGDYERAISSLKLAEPILRDTNNRESLQVCVDAMGLAYANLNQFARARKYLTESAQLCADLKVQPARADALGNLALVEMELNHWDAAERCNREALSLRKTDPDSDLFAIFQSAQILIGRGRVNDAVRMLESIAQRPYSDPARRLDIARGFIHAYRLLGDLSKARQHYRAAQHLLDSVGSGLQERENRLAYYSSQAALYQEWVRTLLDGNAFGEALDATEASRAISMRERFEGRLQDSSISTTNYLQLARTQKAALVSYWLAPEESYAWVVTPGGVKLCKLPGEERLRDLIESYRAILEHNADPMHSDGSGDRLRAAILGPVLPLIGGAKRVILVPDGPLHSINFEALPINGHYWIEDVTVTLAPSLRVLEMSERRKRSERAPGVMVVGDAVPSAEFPHLEKAGYEIDSIARSFAGRNIVLRNAAATPESYLNAVAPQTYIHFAAHADANAERPLDSAVILSPGANGERLTARALLNKPIDADLVTISACRSAGIRSYRGEGLVGFAWAFLQTGAHGVIAGLWNASDEATSQVMVDLYARIAAGEAPPEALRDAKLALVHSGTHFHLPYYWAPFQYYAGVGHKSRETSVR
jgi:CHAT domain-containing protein/predicted negative regulator of RcsB-dependent stress response